MTDPTELFASFRAVPLFQGLSDDDLASLAARGAVRRVAAGTVLFREGDRADAFYVVLRGKIRIDVGAELVTVLEAGQFFGELALLDGKPRSGSARVVEDATLLSLAQEQFEAFLDSRPAQARRFLAALATYIREHLLTAAPRPSTPSGPLAARLLVDAGGQTLVLGDPQALAQADPALRLFLQWIAVLPGAAEGRIGVARTLCGSTVRLGEYGAAGDLDLEAVLFLERDGGAVADLADPDGAVLAELARYLVAHVERVIAAHPDVCFIELKAGEHARPGAPATPLKWSLAELRAGVKAVDDRVVRLVDALAQDARVKADWAIPAVLPGALPGAYQECSVVYRIGARIGRGQVRPRPSRRPELPILRRFAVALTRDDLELAAEAAIAVRAPSLEETHWSMAASVAKVAGRDTLKVLKRCRGFLSFWDGAAEIAELGPTPATRAQLVQALVEIISAEPVRALALHRSHAELLLTLARLGIDPPDDAAARWLAAARALLGDDNLDLAGASDELSRRIEREVRAMLAARPTLASYVRMVEARAAHAGPLRDRASFVCLVPDDDARAAFRAARARWSPEYPRLRFLEPDDLHVTLGFMGRVPEAVPALAARAARALAPSWRLSGGGVHFMGERHQVLAVRYAATDEQRTTLRRIRFAISAAGGRPDGRLEPVPHLTLASFDRDDPRAVDDAERFLLEQHAGPLVDVALPEVAVWERDDEPAPRAWRAVPGC